MIREKTLDKYSKIIDEIKESGLSINKFFKSKSSSIVFFRTIARIKEEAESGNEKIVSFLNKYNELINRNVSSKPNVTISEIEEEIDNNQQSEVFNIRNDEGKIIYYKYKIYKKNKLPLEGKLSKEEMNTIYRLYTYYGDNLTARIVSRYFPDFSLPDFKRILRAFNIYKDSGSFAPHMYEDHSEEELRDIQLREKENSFLRKAEEDNIKNNEKLLKKYAIENIELKQKLETLSDIKIEIPEVTPITWDEYEPCGQSINLYFADFHLGSYTTSGSLYDTNNNYGFDEAKRRLTKVLIELGKFNCFDTINIVLLGDMIDCCGITGMTARMDHVMPNNMDPKEQVNKFIELMDWFICSLVDSDRALTSKVNIYSVPNGNHAGNYEYVLNKYLMSYINAKFPNIHTELFEKFYGKFELNGHVFIPMHGKDSEYMKKPLPLNLDDKSKVMIYEWLMSEGITSEKVHFIKGDLHSNALSSCKKFDYRNVLSLYGSSDYCAYNYSANSYGVSYDLMIGDNLVRGTFENI